MRPRTLLCLFTYLGLAPWLATAEDLQPARAGDPPVLRLQAGGPTSYVTGLAFSPDGQRLYEAGWDKVIRVWKEDPGTSRYLLDARATYRIPIGPGLDGAINAMALSTDGRWLAVAGRGIVPGASGFHRHGLIIPAPAKSDEMRWEEGAITVFDTTSPVPKVTRLRGHRGPVLSLAFAPSRPDKPPLLVSAALEMDQAGEVRLWDVAKGEYLTGLAGLPGADRFKTRPALTAWHTGAGRTQVRVAIAWWAGTFGKDPGTLRCWTADQGQSVLKVTDGAVNDTLAYLPDRSELLSGSFLVPGPNDRATAPQGQLTSWRTDGTPWLRPVPTRRIFVNSADRKPANSSLLLPRAVSVVPSPGDAAPKYIALILQDLRATDAYAAYSLRLVDITKERYGATAAHVPLRTTGAVNSAQPVLAVDPSGTKLALVLGESREITTFSIADLTAGKVDPRQRLQSAGMAVAYVGFAKRAGQHALVLSTKGPEHVGAPVRPIAADDLVVDFAARGLTDTHEGWVVAQPTSNDGWGVQYSPARSEPNQGITPEAIRVRKGQEAWRALALQSGETVTAYAFHPKPPGGEPLIAIASQAGTGEPYLRLYSTRTGDWIRQFTGHAERIGCLAFSEDGRLLASAAEDRTTNVWSLVDLGETWEKRGQIRGLAVTLQGDRLVVMKPPETQADTGGLALRAGDRIEGIVSGGELRPLRTVVDFYNAISMIRPGHTATLRRVGSGDVPIRVVQGTDERKPLFSLYMTPGERADSWRWISWNPQGPYETSDLEFESLVGWHFNTGKPETPTRFALAPEYHDKFYHENITKILMERGSLPPPEVPPLPAPNLSMAVDQDAEIVRGDQILVRQTPRELSLSLVDRPIPLDRIASVIARVGVFAPAELQTTNDRLWAVDVSGWAWKPGIYPVQITLKTNETPAQSFSVHRRIRFQRPAPAITAPERPPAVVNDPEYLVRAEVKTDGQTAVKVRVTHEPGGESREQVLRTSSTIALPFALEPGTNRFRVEALNLEAVSGFEADETTELPPLIVNYKKKALAPTVELSIVPSPGDEPDAEPVGNTVQVTLPKVTLRGTIKGEEPLTVAEQQSSTTKSGRPLSRFVAGRDRSFAIEETLTLVPGSQTFVVRARSADSDSGEGRVTLDYQPRLPRLIDREFNPERPVLFESEDPAQVAVSANLARPDDLHPVKGEVLIDSDEAAQPTVLPAEIKTNDADPTVMHLTAKVPLSPGENHIRIRMTNEWGAEWTSADDVVSFRRPPRIVEVKAPAKTEQASTVVTATVESATEITEAQVEVRHDGEAAWVKAEPSRMEGTRWAITAANVPLEVGESQIRVRALNLDGWNHQPGPFTTLTYTRREPPAPPILETPETPLTTALAELPIPIAIRSSKPLAKTELRHLTSESSWKTIDVDALTTAGRDEEGRTLSKGTTRAQLNEGVNSFELVTSNSDGETRVKFEVSRIQPPIRFTIDGLQSESARTKLLSPKNPVPDSRVWIVGRVHWPDPEIQQRNQKARIQILVNGFPQAETSLLPIQDRPAENQAATTGPKPSENQFRAGVLLNQRENSITLKLSGVATAADELPLTVTCLNPNPKQRLHMLVIGIGEQDKSAIKKLAVQAVNGKLDSEGKNERNFKTPAFSNGRIYGPLCNEFTKLHVMAQLSLICEQIRLRNTAATAPSENEVVLIYYQGGEWVGADRSALLLRRSRDKKYVDGVTIDELVRPFVNTRGAKLLLLDVATPGPLRSDEPWKRDVSHVGLMRFLWLSPNAAEEQPEIPEDLRLIQVLKDALPNTITFGQVTSKISGRYSQLRSKYPNRFVFEDQPLPNAFYDLLFGKP